MKELPSPRPGYRWEPILVPIDAPPAPAPVVAAPAADRRAYARVATIMRTGILRAPAGRAPCIVRDISPGGALVAGRLAPAPGSWPSRSRGSRSA
ncbi:MAG TPA: PilZ domain-containing protein, partial [Allosphingosinicella sp.]|nr:PilZ domain-containing protein [Allosphingosinicella sp.]